MRVPAVFIALVLAGVLVSPPAYPCTPERPTCTSGGARLPSTASAPWIPFVPGRSAEGHTHSLVEHEVVLLDGEGQEVPLIEHPPVAEGASWSFLEPARPLVAGETLRLSWKSFCDHTRWPHEGEFPRELELTVGPDVPVPASFGSASVLGAWAFRESTPVTPCSSDALIRTGTEIAIELSPAAGMEPFLETAQLGWRVGGGEWSWSMPGWLVVAPKGGSFKHRTRCTGRFVDRFEFALHIPGSEVQPEPVAVDVDVACAAESPPSRPPPEASGSGCAAGSSPVAPAGALAFVASLLLLRRGRRQRKAAGPIWTRRP